MGTGSVPAPDLGLHVHVRLEGARLVAVRLAREPGGAPTSPDAAALLARVARHLETGREDFSDVPLDLAGVGDFQRRALEWLVRNVPAGRTITYGQLATRLGNPAASRAVGAAMARNPIPLVVPCHRVLGTNGGVTNYSGEGGWATKRALLQLEGVHVF